MTKLVPSEHRSWLRKLVPGVLVIACLTIAVGGVARMLRTDDQDVKVYSVTPEGKVQVIGLGHRTYGRPISKRFRVAGLDLPRLPTR